MHFTRWILTALLFVPLFGQTAEVDDVTLLIRQLRKSPGNPATLLELKGKIGGIGDPDREATALALYSLGQLQNENLAEALKARQALAARHPDSTYLQLIQFDQLDRSCRLCNGTGEKRLAVCDKCAGSRRCLACGGKGFKEMMNKKRVSCAACGGSGRCPECGGTGRKKAACPECKGRGSILDQRKIRQVSQAVAHDFLKKHDPAGDTPPSEDTEEQTAPRRRSREFPEP